MEKFVEELKKAIRFKDTTEVGDVVLVAGREPQTLIYALVSGIDRDRTKREEWWHVTMQFLTLPPQEVVWILRTPQLTGREIFTMDGDERFVKAVDFGSGPPKGRFPPDKPAAGRKLRVVK